MTNRACMLATEQFAALLVEAEPALWGRGPGKGVLTLDPTGTVYAFRMCDLTAAELRVIALAAQTLASAAYEAAIDGLADTLTTERRRR